MPIATISRQGLTAIATLVVILWGCLAAERLIVYQANRGMRRIPADYYRSHLRPRQSSKPRPGMSASLDRSTFGI